MQLILPTPLYQGNGVTTIETFYVPPVPYYNQPVSQWTLTDPTTVTLEFGLAASLTTWTYGVSGGIQRSSTGLYYAELDTTPSAGFWEVKWKGTGACAAIDIAGFLVTASPF